MDLTMKTIGYVRVSTDKQADRGVFLEAQAEKFRAMAVVHNALLLDIIVDGGESAKSLNRPGMARLLALVDAGEVQTVIIAKLDRLGDRHHLGEAAVYGDFHGRRLMEFGELSR